MSQKVLNAFVTWCSVMWSWVVWLKGMNLPCNLLAHLIWSDLNTLRLGFSVPWIYIFIDSMHLGKWPTWRTILYHVFTFIFNSLHVWSTSCSPSGETNCINTTSGNCHFVLVAVSWAGPTCTRHGHWYRLPTYFQSGSYQSLYWHTLSLLIMSMMCLKHVDS